MITPGANGKGSALAPRISPTTSGLTFYLSYNCCHGSRPLYQIPNHHIFLLVVSCQRWWVFVVWSFPCHFTGKDLEAGWQGNFHRVTRSRTSWAGTGTCLTLFLTSNSNCNTQPWDTQICLFRGTLLLLGGTQRKGRFWSQAMKWILGTPLNM